ncbi:formate dehydrogenase subunit gamma [Azospirillum sp. RWY-5-1]|uniref:Formate dehydrogenase subunit gamma n=1 Tax=Azospirillum oleiclasticum TaxID=2735135 RepID=A0ABX2TAL4_9PROT|nr:formate dehydrogenase subunit gamma [Azospirillum oleiclasticum]NYZ15187.1 formate dehydrogenase subunit gamma [Azospirillum oleiclasticum]NYZ21392.1 formate dehydrogenase subunit gamma [Azospirillum oleiclasticum]
MTGSHYRDEPTTVSRYSAAARVNHWVTAASLILLALSGLALFHPSLFFLTGLFGGGEYTRIIHPWIGLVLLVSFAGLFLRFWRLNLWERTDNVWLGRVRAVLAGREEELPEVGKYNAGQKLVFWGMSILIIVLFVSGVGIWRSQYPFLRETLGIVIPIDQQRLAVLVHALAAIGAILIWIVHVYAALWVKGTVRAMMRGSVTGGWAWRHHRRWLREEVGARTPRRPAE